MNQFGRTTGDKIQYMSWDIIKRDLDLLLHANRNPPVLSPPGSEYDDSAVMWKVVLTRVLEDYL